MNNPLDRKMFREAGMSKQPMGILASSPELMSAAKGYELGGAVGSTGDLNQTYNKPKFEFFNTPGENDGLGEIGTSKIGDTLKEEKENKIKQDLDSIEAKPNINDTNKNILDNKQEDFDPMKLMPFGQNLNIRGKQNLSAAEDLSLIGASGDVTTAMQKVATATTKDFKDTNIAGTTYNKAINDLTSQINKEGKEIGLDDVYDEGIKLLNYDPRDLEKNYDADRRQAFWFNLMNAGLQIAAGESSNALTNVAKGLGSGLQSFGKDVGDLKDDLREDRKESTNVMYRLLGNKRSEQLAKEALELDKKAKIFNITQTEVGQMRSTEIAKANANFEEKKFNLNYLVELKKMDQTEQLSENKIKAALQRSLIQNKAISTPFLLGLITPKDGFTMDTVDISDPNSYSFTPEGIKIAKDIYDNTRTYKPTNREQIKKENLGKATGPAGIVFEKPSKNDGTLATNWAQDISSQFVKDVSADPENAAKLLIDHVSRYSEQGAQIDLNKIKTLYPELHRYFISNKLEEDETEVENSSPLKTMPNLFKNSVNLSKSSNE